MSGNRVVRYPVAWHVVAGRGERAGGEPGGGDRAGGGLFATVGVPRQPGLRCGGGEQRFRLAAQRRVSSARILEERGAVARCERERALHDVPDRQPALGRHAAPPPRGCSGPVRGPVTRRMRIAGVPGSCGEASITYGSRVHHGLRRTPGRVARRGPPVVRDDRTHHAPRQHRCGASRAASGTVADGRTPRGNFARPGRYVRQTVACPDHSALRAATPAFTRSPCPSPRWPPPCTSAACSRS